MATMKANWIPAATPPDSDRDVLVAYQEKPSGAAGMACGAYCKDCDGDRWIVDVHGFEIEAVAWMDLPAMPEGI
jgi:hypothetical protein